MNKKIYEERYSEITKEKTELNKKFNTISMLRLFSVAAAVVSVCISRSIPFIVISAVFTVLFFYLIRVHCSIEKKLSMLVAEEKVVKAYLDRFTGNWKNAVDNGERFLSADFPQGRDLDIFGRASLYQFTCQAYTARGKERLADTLRYGCKGIDDISDTQQAIKEISEKRDFKNKFQCCTSLLENQSKGNDDIAGKISDKAPVSVNIFFKLLMWILPAADITLILLYIADVYPQIAATFACIVTAFSFFFSCIENVIGNRAMKETEEIRKCIHSYSDIITLISNESFSSAKLQKLKSAISDTNAAAEIKKLEKISDLAEIRSNAIAFFLCNAFLMWDVHCINSITKWQNRNRGKIKDWFDVIAEFETIISLSVLTDMDITYTYPEITESTEPFISFSDLRHPLIDFSSVVGNSASFESSSVIITGSNMSGKTTFMRSIGVNLILATSGAPVAADSFKASYMTVLTSMRTEDSVSDGISTFYAELVRIKGMVEYAAENKPAVMLIDEIFKGTNSKDRITCAEETIKRLNLKNIITVVTTHDFELCSAELGADSVINYHFSEYYENDTIKFDYKIKKGRCTTTNAVQLLKMVGIVK